MTELRQRRPRVEDSAFLAFTRELPCCVCGRHARSQAAHIRMANDYLGKLPTGMQEKPDDMWAVPLCGPLLGAVPAVIGCHAKQHSMNEHDFWEQAGLDPFKISCRNYAKYLSARASAAKHLSILATSAANRRSTSKPRKTKARKKTPVRPRQRAKIPKRKDPWPKFHQGDDRPSKTIPRSQWAKGRKFPKRRKT